MPKFAVEVQYLLPVWNCVIVEAENADAAQKAVMFDESSHTWDQQVEDYESSRASTIEGWREIPDEYDAEDLNAATPQGLWDFIHEPDDADVTAELRRFRVHMERSVNECRRSVVAAHGTAEARHVRTRRAMNFAAIEGGLQIIMRQFARLPDPANVSRLVAMAMRPSALIVAGGMLLPC